MFILKIICAMFAMGGSLAMEASEPVPEAEQTEQEVCVNSMDVIEVFRMPRYVSDILLANALHAPGTEIPTICLKDAL